MAGAEQLASYRRCVDRIGGGWDGFQVRRRERLRQRERYGHAAERATENILEDLFTNVLDWPLADLNNQVGYADLLLTRLGIKHLIVEAKKPGALLANPRAAEQALQQACGYAREQRVNNVAVSDGHFIYAAELAHDRGGESASLRPRCFAGLDGSDPMRSAEELFWISRHGIYRPSQQREREPELPMKWGEAFGSDGVVAVTDEPLHPKYRLPARCFAYVGAEEDPKTWHLPYLHADGKVDARRLPKAVQSILTNYRGATLTSVPEAEIPEVLVRLACAAAGVGKMPDQNANAAPAYRQLADALEQLGRSADIEPLGA